MILKYQKKKLHKINITSHRFGPLYSIFLASKRIKNIVGENEVFISYSDINWNWSFNNIKKIVKKKRVVIFTHRGFHPHLEVDSKSDFCFENKKKNIIGISQKKSFSKDYKKDLLAIGCYYFSNYNIIDKFFNRCSYLFKKKNREFYIVSLIKDLCPESKTCVSSIASSSSFLSIDFADSGLCIFLILTLDPA